MLFLFSLALNMMGLVNVLIIMPIVLIYETVQANFEKVKIATGFHLSLLSI